MVYPRDLTKIPAPVMAVLQTLIPSDWPEVWADLAAVFYVGLLNADTTLPHEVLAQIALEQVLAAVEQIGGQQLYVPRGAKRSNSNKAECIRNEFNGRNHAELAVRHGITEMRIRQIVGGNVRKSPGNPSQTLPAHPKKLFGIEGA